LLDLSSVIMKKRTVIPIAELRSRAAVREREQGSEKSEEGGLDRRAFLKLMAASAALAGAGCSGPPQEVIVPYVRMPEMMVPGRPVYYASAFVHRGRAEGVLVECNMGRPTKIEGNPQYPASLGATSTFAQASILQLWDPDRSQSVYRGKAISTWEAFETALQARRAHWDSNGGSGLRILTGTITSPTLADQLAALLRRYPNARWHCHDALHDDAGIEAAHMAFGEPADMLPQLGKARIVVTIDADLFDDWPGALRHARDFAQLRRSSRNDGNRLYAIEPRLTLTGARADNRLELSPRDIERLIWRVAERIGMSGVQRDSSSAPGVELERWDAALAKMLFAHRGESIIVAGGCISAHTRALVHAMNAMLGNIGKTIMPIAPVEAGTLNHLDSISSLAVDMHAGAVDSLIMLDVNPAYDAPSDMMFERALSKVPFSVHLGLYRDETGQRSAWHLPQSHGYEAWSDARAHDGTASIVQPVIAPLYGGRSPHELIALASRDDMRNGHALVRRYWSRHAVGTDFEAFWQDALRSGVIRGSAFPALRLKRPQVPPAPPAPLSTPFDASTLVATFVADPASGLGEFANNGWLQELPRPFTKLTWDNAALVGTETAKTHGLESGDVVRLNLKGAPEHALDIPVWVLPQHAEGVVTLPLGYGRTAAGRVGNGVGFDTYRLRTTATMRTNAELQLRKTGRTHVLATTQHHFTMEGRDIVRMATLEEFRRNPHFATDEPKKRVPKESLYPDWEYNDYKWGMAIDLNACIGCNACTIACQAENNIPVVGKEEVLRGREMHWIRVDHYVVGAARSVFQPVPCMHCETAPCEEVCPVGATVHDSEGLNVQVYNRCVGTRFCSNNCPYKVRRFNFLQYSNNDVESLKAVQNPEVTVRRRGVMEKCTYCLQRITRARIEAEKLGRKVQDGEVVTACQAVCPTEAILFGDLNDPHSKVNRAKASPLDYALLSELNTRPRTTYTALVINPDPDLE
jgi:Fe-S-cluster-containing dehydrogenase component/anaerobic selenocysteine-containing dehydrogenase